MIIDYSNSNFENIFQSYRFEEFIKKVVVIHPLIYDINFDRFKKSDIITLFSLDNNQRRLHVYNKLNSLKCPYKNVTNIFSKNDILELYKKTKILINVHQTEHHDTLEELRVLPALLNGVLIISEKSALTEYIPYNEYIIWCDYQNLKDTVEEVYNNYDYYYNKIFINNNLRNILDKMRVHNSEVFYKYIK